MAMVRTSGTLPEMRLRSILHRRGLRYRVDYRPPVAVRCRLDIAFTVARVAVLVDGCFWHGCPEHASWPKSNADWWRAKIDRNRERDAKATHALRDAGWAVLRVWEHESAEDAADRVQGLLCERRSKHVSAPNRSDSLRGAIE
jgi:DNA mismatch endonuclease (patch repair protein)